MAKEIEPRFLLPVLPDLIGAKAVPIIQGYLVVDPVKTVRIRRKGDDGYITVKGPKVDGEGDEFEYPIPVNDAMSMLDMCGTDNTLGKDRYEWLSPDNKIWEVDNFTGKHEGLVIAEIELPSRATPYQKPVWIERGVDITNDFRFANASLTQISRAEMIRNIVEVFSAAGITPPALTP